MLRGGRLDDAPHARARLYLAGFTSSSPSFQNGCTDPLFSLGRRLTATQVSEDNRRGVMTGGA
jgi:hypothetical protein